MMSISAIAQSGMTAARVSLDAAANNVANASTEGYRRLQVTNAEALNGGVEASVSASTAEDGGGSLAEDVVAARQSVYQFSANAQMIRVEDEMIGSLLDTRA
jgi:flagellar hook protein FlgE